MEDDEPKKTGLRILPERVFVVGNQKRTVKQYERSRSFSQTVKRKGMKDYEKEFNYSVGKVTVPLADDITFEEQAGSEQESDLPIVELKDLPDAIENSDISFGCNNTVITVRQEQIVQIIRHWVP